MSAFVFGAASTKHLSSCHADLQAVAHRALAYGVLDFSVIEGHRAVAEQQKAWREGRSQIDGVSRKGKHNQLPSLAMDLLPYPHRVNGVDVWQDKERFARVAGLVQAAAAELGVAIRWGGDWDGDGNNADGNLHDMPHFELVGE